MITVHEALQIISNNKPDFGVEPLPLSQSLNRQCAAPVKARLTMPPFDASAMDGYAIHIGDAAKGAKLKVIGEAPAGSHFDGQVQKGEAVRIFTGGLVPKGANTIIIQENVNRLEDHITVNEGMERPRHIRKAGIDFKKGDTIIRPATWIGPAEITLAASGNHDTITVHRRPKIAIIANGDELRPPGSKLQKGQIISSNSAGLAALIEYWGCEPIDMGIARDSLESITERIKAARNADIIIPVGGASVGDYDYMKQAFSDLGLNQTFSKVSVKPGKPVWFGTLGTQKVLGLPGNPTSANVCAHLFLKPLIGINNSLIEATLNAPLAKNSSRETYLRGRLSLTDGQLMVDVFPNQDSSLTLPLTQANTLIKLKPEQGPWAKGSKITVIPLGMGPNIAIPNDL